MAEAIANRHISGDGPFTKRAQEFLERETGCGRALLTTNCTHALEMTALLLNIQPGDEVVLPAFTFVSTANAYVLRGARPIFADIRRDTLNIDERQVEALISPRTKAIVAVHYAGIACDMEVLMSIGQRYGIPIVEDNAHGLFGTYDGKQLGTFGALATQSFHETKNFTCGEGGALLVNDPALVERAEILREKGTNRARFFRGQVDKYTWVDEGSSWIPSDLLAAFLFAQFEQKERIQQKRKDIWNRYDRSLRPWAEGRGIAPPHIPDNCEQSYHMYYLLLPTLEIRTAFIEHLKNRGVNAVFHYLPLNRAPEAQRIGVISQCPVTEDISNRLVRLPFYNELAEDQQLEVISATMDFLL